MSGYRRVNYYELCRLCTSSEGSKIYIFREEGRRRQLQTKIQTCLPIQVLEEDSLPKIVCHECVKKLESFIEFRETVVSAEGMLESYFTSLRFSEDFLKEGKVYVKSTEKERPATPESDMLKSIDKVTPPGNQIVHTDQQISQQPVVVSNINASNIQIISGVQARVQQYKCAMQMQGGLAAAVVEATAETHYSYQQQTSQQVSPQSNEAHNQINEQQTSTPQIQQVQNQMQNHAQINQQMQPQRQITQQLNQSNQIPQQQNQTQVNQQNQSQITQQIQQLQRQQREFEKQHRQMQQIDKQQVQMSTQQEFPIKQEAQVQVVHQNNNIILEPDSETKQAQPIIQKVQSEVQKDESATQNVQTFTAVQTSPEVFLNLGFKETPLITQTVREESKEFKEFQKSDDAISRNSIGQISEFLRIKSAPEPTSLITVNPQVISQTHRTATCKDCGKIFQSVNQLNTHTCSVQSLLSETGEGGGNKEDTLQSSNTSFSCDVCGKLFKRKEHLYQHRKLHTGERPYMCTTCGKSFSRKEHLVRHSVSHTGEKMHECEVCGKSFSRKDNLHKHRKTHGVTGPRTCETCGKSFVVKHYYLMHLATHTSSVPEELSNQDRLPYKCDICHKAFSVKHYLTTHKLRHRSKNNNNSSGQNAINNQQQQQQQQQPQQQQQTQQSNTTNNVNIVGNNVTNPGNLNNNNGQSTDGTTVEMQSVIERSDQTNSSFNNQYHNNMQEFQ